MLKHEFSWSLTRHKTFEQCHRKYYFHYYASWGGWDKIAEDRTRLLFHLKKLQSVQSWTESVFRKILQEAVLAGKIEPKHLSRLALTQIRKEAIDIKNNESADDAKMILLSELYYGNSSIESLLKQAEQNIEILFAGFAASQASDIINNINSFAIKNIPRPASFLLNGIKIWANPDFICTEKGNLRIINLSFKDPLKSTQWAFKAALDIMLTEELFPGKRQVGISSFFLHENDFPEITITRNRKEVKTIIDNSCREMLELTDLDTNVREEVFKKADNNACEFCNFRRACQV